jgi:large subunit ribosomal protein L31
MREGIHPNYVEATVSCACGSSFVTRSTKQTIRLEICSSCHPFFTGRQKFIDTAGRVERFQKRFAKTGGETVLPTKKVKPAMVKGQQSALSKKAGKVLSSAPIRTKPLSTSKVPMKPGTAPAAPAKSGPAKTSH